MVKDEEAPADGAQASKGASGGDASGGRKKRKAAVKKEVIVLSGSDEPSSGEEEAYKPGAESESEDEFVVGVEEEEEPASESEDEPIAKKKKAAAAGASKKKKKKKDEHEDDYAPPPEPSPMSKGAASKAQAKATAKKAELATGAPTFACRMAGVTAEDWIAAQAPFVECTGKKLSALLKHNHLATSGVNKAELVARCAEAVLLGCLPTCPACHQARLKFDEKGSKIAVELMLSCPGHFSDDRAKFFVCNFVAPATGVKRAAWRSLGEAAPAGEAAGDAAGGDAAGPAAALLDDATAARIAALPDARAAADAVLVEVTRLKLSVPSAGLPRQEVAAALLAHRDSATGAWDARKVLAVLAEKYPAPVSFNAGGAGGAGGGDASCRVAANAPMAEAFSALAQAADDQWKRNTFTTATMAIRLWPMPILKGKELSEGPRKVQGVGASCAKLIDEFIATGKIAPKPK